MEEWLQIALIVVFSVIGAMLLIFLLMKNWLDKQTDKMFVKARVLTSDEFNGFNEWVEKLKTDPRYQRRTITPEDMTKYRQENPDLARQLDEQALINAKTKKKFKNPFAKKKDDSKDIKVGLGWNERFCLKVVTRKQPKPTKWEASIAKMKPKGKIGDTLDPKKPNQRPDIITPVGQPVPKAELRCANAYLNPVEGDKWASALVVWALIADLAIDGGFGLLGIIPGMDLILDAGIGTVVDILMCYMCYRALGPKALWGMVFESMDYIDVFTTVIPGVSDLGSVIEFACFTWTIMAVVIYKKNLPAIQINEMDIPEAIRPLSKGLLDYYKNFSKVSQFAVNTMKAGMEIKQIATTGQMSAGTKALVQGKITGLVDSIQQPITQAATTITSLPTTIISPQLPQQNSI